MTVRRERGMLHRRPVVDLNAVLASGGDDLAAIELQRRDAVIILDGLEDASAPEIPDLEKKGRREFSLGCTHTLSYP